MCFITWNVSPEIFHFGTFSLHWYGLLFAGGFVLGYFIMRKIFRQEDVPLKLLDRVTWYMIFGTLIGARLGHCLFYEPEYFLKNPLEILLPIARDIHGTYQFVGFQGFASHGAALGILAALYIFSRVERQPYIWVLDRMSIVAALSCSLIRLGNLFNSEIYGRSTGLPWGFKFVRSPEWQQAPVFAQPCHPTQIYEALAYLVIFACLCRMYFKNEKTKSGVLFGIFLISMFTVRFLIEFLKLEQVGFEKGMLLNMGQLLSIPFILYGIYLFRKTMISP